MHKKYSLLTRIYEQAPAGAGLKLPLKSSSNSSSSTNATYKVGRKRKPVPVTVGVDSVWDPAGPGWQTINVTKGVPLAAISFNTKDKKWKDQNSTSGFFGIYNIATAGDKNQNAELAEFIAGAVLQGHPAGGSTLSYDAIAGNGGKFEVKYQSALGSSFRTGTSGKAAISTANALIGSFVVRCRDVISDIDQKLAQLEAEHNASEGDVTPYSPNEILTAIKKTLKDFIDLGFGKKGGASETDLESIVARGEITIGRLGTATTAIAAIEELLADCSRAAMAAKAYELAQWEYDPEDPDLAPAKKQQMDFMVQMAERFWNVGSPEGAVNKAARMRGKYADEMDRFFKENPEVQLPNASTLDVFICSIEKRVLEHEFFYDVAEGQSRADWIGNILLQSPESRANVMSNYMGATTYADAEKEKKQIQGWVFVVGGGFDVGHQGARIHIITKEASIEAVKNGDLVLSGITQSSPSFALSSESPSEPSEQ